MTDIEHAKAFKRMGVPLNTPVETRYFSATYSKRWFGLMKAQDDFYGALADFDGTAATWKRVNDQFEDILAQINLCQRCRLKRAERQIMEAFLTERAIPFFEHWDAAINAVDGRATLTITAADIPAWTNG